jgi:hypothetical protein
MYGMSRSLWSVGFDTDHGASVIDLSNFVYMALGQVNGNTPSGSMKGWKFVSFQKRLCIMDICKSWCSLVKTDDRWICVRFPAGARDFSVLHHLRPVLGLSQLNEWMTNC